MFKKPIIACSLISGLVFGSHALAAPKIYIDEANVTELVKIIDGDSFRANVEGLPDIIGEDIRIKVYGITVPQMRGKCEFEKGLAKISKQVTEKLLKSSDNIVLKNIRRSGLYELNADVFYNGINLAEVLTKTKIAVPYTSSKDRVDWCDTDKLLKTLKEVNKNGI